MAELKSTLIERLLKAPLPEFRDDSEPRESHSVVLDDVSNDDIPELIDIARKWNDDGWLHELIRPDVSYDAAHGLPATAWRALGDLKAEAAIAPLIELLSELDEYDEWPSDEWPHVFGKIGEASFEPLFQLATDLEKEELVRSSAARGLAKIAQYHPDTRGRIVGCLVSMMTKAADDDIRFNTRLMELLVELQAVGAAESIELAFAGDHIDTALLGDWDSVRRMLGVQGLGLQMPEHPYDSREFISGVGIFSKRPVFCDGEVDDDGEEAYYHCAEDAFSSSSEGKQTQSRYGELGWFRCLLNFGIKYRGETIDEMTCGTLREFVLDYVPKKVSTKPESAPAIVGELLAFWEFIDRAYGLPEAKSIVDWLKTKGLAKELKEALSDDSNFGMAKALFTMGADAGFDMTSDAGVNSFLQAYNAVVSSQHSPQAPVNVTQAPITREERVGRNDPCPCGSGKKFKKCCARSD